MLTKHLFLHQSSDGRGIRSDGLVAITERGLLLVDTAWSDEQTEAPPLLIQAPGASAEPAASREGCPNSHELCREDDFARANRVDAPGKGEWTLVANQRAYLSLPRRASAPLPAILVLHTARGLTKNIQLWSDRLAEEGYAVLAIDLYHGRVARTDSEGFALRDAANARAPENMSATKEAYAMLSRDGRVQARRIALVGWSFGGAWATYLSTEPPAPAAVVSYAGNAISDLETAKRVNAPILMVRGFQDRVFGAEEAAAFQDRLSSANKSVDLIEVDGGHALADPTREGYSREGDWAAFIRVREFLKSRLVP